MLKLKRGKNREIIITFFKRPKTLNSRLFFALLIALAIHALFFTLFKVKLYSPPVLKTAPIAFVSSQKKISSSIQTPKNYPISLPPRTTKPKIPPISFPKNYEIFFTSADIVYDSSPYTPSFKKQGFQYLIEPIGNLRQMKISSKPTPIKIDELPKGINTVFVEVRIDSLTGKIIWMNTDNLSFEKACKKILSKVTFEKNKKRSFVQGKIQITFFIDQ